MTRYFLMKYNPLTGEDIDITDFSYQSRQRAIKMMYAMNDLYSLSSFAFRVAALPQD